MVGGVQGAVEAAAEEQVAGVYLGEHGVAPGAHGEVVFGQQVGEPVEVGVGDGLGESVEVSRGGGDGVYVRALVPARHVHAALPGQQPRLGDIGTVRGSETAQEAVGEVAGMSH